MLFPGGTYFLGRCVCFVCWREACVNSLRALVVLYKHALLFHDAVVCPEERRVPVTYRRSYHYPTAFPPHPESGTGSFSTYIPQTRCVSRCWWQPSFVCPVVLSLRWYIRAVGIRQADISYHHVQACCRGHGGGGESGRDVGGRGGVHHHLWLRGGSWGRLHEGM